MTNFLPPSVLFFSFSFFSADPKSYQVQTDDFVGCCFWQARHPVIQLQAAAAAADVARIDG